MPPTYGNTVETPFKDAERRTEKAHTMRPTGIHVLLCPPLTRSVAQRGLEVVGAQRGIFFIFFIFLELWFIVISPIDYKTPYATRLRISSEEIIYSKYYEVGHDRRLERGTARQHANHEEFMEGPGGEVRGGGVIGCSGGTRRVCGHRSPY